MWAQDPQFHCLSFVYKGLSKVPHQKDVPKDITLHKVFRQKYYKINQHVPLQINNKEGYGSSTII
jgi:hypothetical protein